MSFNIKSLFVNEVNEVPKTPAEPAPNLTPRQNVSVNTGIITSPVQSVAPDAHIKELLQKAMLDNALNSFDYLKFKQALVELRAAIPNEGQAFKAAYVAAKTLGISKDKLVETAEHYITVLKEEMRKFTEAVESQAKEQVEGVAHKVEDLAASIAAKNEQIQKLSDEVAALQKDKINAANQLNENKLKLDNAMNNFTSTFKDLSSEISNDIEKMKSYL